MESIGFEKLSLIKSFAKSERLTLKNVRAVILLYGSEVWTLNAKNKPDILSRRNMVQMANAKDSVLRQVQQEHILVQTIEC